MSQGSKNIDDFMQEAELQHHLDAMRTKLRVTNVAQLKYVEEEDLVEIGMTKPEIRRLKKQYDKECPKGAFGKLRRVIVFSYTFVILGLGLGLRLSWLRSNAKAIY